MARNKTLYSLLIAALMVALGLVLPLFLGQVQILNQSISPMHIPALIAGLTCGPIYGAAAGFIMPLLRMVIFGMPPVAVAVPMAFELAAYAAFAGLFYPIMVRVLKKGHLPAMLVAMLIAMLAGRLIGGAAKAIFMGLNGNSYAFSTFINAYFVTTAVGAVVHLIVCPVITLALEKARLSPLGATLDK